MRRRSQLRCFTSIANTDLLAAYTIKGGHMTLWLWPGVVVVGIALIDSIPNWGLWMAAAVAAAALLADYAGSGWRLGALLVPVALMSASVALAASWAAVSR